MVDNIVTTTKTNKTSLRLGLHDAIYLTDSSVFMSSHSMNNKAIKNESTSLNGIVSDKSHRESKIFF